MIARAGLKAATPNFLIADEAETALDVNRAGRMCWSLLADPAGAARHDSWC